MTYFPIGTKPWKGTMATNITSKIDFLRYQLMLLANISRANNRRKNVIHEQKWFKFGWKYFIKSLMNNHAWFLTKIISIKILSTPIHIDSLRFSSMEDIHVIFRMSQLKVLYILLTQSQRKYRRRRIPDAKKFYIIYARDKQRTV